jgi:hypothetical protein
MPDETPSPVSAPAPQDLRAALLLEMQTSVMFKGMCLNLQKQVIAAAEEIDRLKAAIDDRDRGTSEIVGRLQGEIDRLVQSSRDQGAQANTPETNP